ncbi:type 2 periplasmic-binding domain-containing protein [Lysobacter gummosus]|uniref:hypothetical protein n=1 Tax=Lysobacter gummosus TaxID=262324 RepID=UPI003634C02F
MPWRTASSRRCGALYPWRRLCGTGIARSRRPACGFIDSGQLAQVMTDWQDKTFPLCALYTTRHLPAAKLRAFVYSVAALAQGRRATTD